MSLIPTQGQCGMCNKRFCENDLHKIEGAVKIALCRKCAEQVQTLLATEEQDFTPPTFEAPLGAI